MNIIPPASLTKMVQTDMATLCKTTKDVAAGPSDIADMVSFWSAHHRSSSTLTVMVHRETQTSCPAGFQEDEPLLHQERLKDDGNGESTPQRAFYCHMCGKRFFAQDLLEEHRRSTHPQEEGRHCCRYCPYSSYIGYNVSRHEQTHTSEQSFMCHVCGKGFVQREQLTHHLVVHSEDGNSESTPQPAFYCNTCWKGFSTQDLLEEHRRSTHPQEEGRHRCRYCPYSHDYKHYVDIHERIHTGERPFVCHVCGKGFVDRQHLTRHLAVHLAEKPHKCADCERRFCQASSLARHRTEQHPVDGGVDLPMCPHCNKKFSRWHRLKTHLLMHTGERPYACSQCEQRFKQRCDATQHEKLVHDR